MSISNIALLLLVVIFSLQVGCSSSPISSDTNEAAAKVNRIELEVLLPESRNWNGSAHVGEMPASVGVVFPEGEMGSQPRGRVVDEQGNDIPIEAEVTGWWDADQRHIKWLLLHLNAEEAKQYWFVCDQTPIRSKGNPLATADLSSITIDTGPLRAVISRDQPTIFDSITAHGKAIPTNHENLHTLVVDHMGDQTPTTLTDWSAELEQASPQRASIKGKGYYVNAKGDRIAMLEMRYQFFKDKAFVRLYHTITWMVEDPQVGVSEMGMKLPIALPDSSSTEVGIHPDEQVERYYFSSAQAVASTSVTAYQSDPSKYVITADGKKDLEGKKLSGFISTDNGQQAISLSQRYAWENYPTQFRNDGGRLAIDFWPASHEHMGFMPRDIMGDRIYYDEKWNRFPFVENKGHFVNNYENTTGFEYTAEGAAWTHELTVGFHAKYEADERAEQIVTLNAATQHPIVLRQDPESAMRVPFMGMSIPPYADNQPTIENAAAWLGRLAMARWESENNFGLLRFGMVRWSKHGNYTYYRWMDNTQYDQQMIPWLLFMRGGDRRFHDDGVITSRYCMDMNVNHYNTRDSPTGYMATCGGALPFANFAFTPWNLKGQKLHFLSYYWHLTGYPRAKEVMDKVIAGTKEFALKEMKEKGPHALAGGREMYNMNRFWAMAYEETHDPEIAELAANSRHVAINREYNEETNKWGGPKVYLYNGLLAQDDAFADPELRDVMKSHLSRSMLDQPGNGVEDPSDIIATDWAYQQTGDERYAKIGWDVSRGLSKLAPVDVDLDGDEVPTYPYAYLGNAIVRMHLLPMLCGLRAGQRAGLTEVEQPTAFMHDPYIWLIRAKKKGDPSSLEMFVKRQPAMSQIVTLHIKTRGDQPITVEAFDADGRVITQRTYAAEPMVTATIDLQQGPGDTVCRIVVSREADASVLIETELPAVYHIPAGDTFSAESNSGGQGYTPIRLYTRAVGEPVGLHNRAQRPYAIIGPEHSYPILRPKLFTPDEKTKPIDAGSPIMFIVRGSRSYGEWTMSGVSRYLAPSAEQWFTP